MSLRDKTLFISDGSRGIGLQIALRAARDGANAAMNRHPAEPHLKLPGTVFTAAAKIPAAGGRALPMPATSATRRRSRPRSRRRRALLLASSRCASATPRRPRAGEPA